MPQDHAGVCVSERVCVEGFKSGGLWMTECNWQAQTHRSGESMGPARAYLLPMMKPNTMKTRMMVPATATTAMMMTGFCSLDTIAADNTDKERHIFFRRLYFGIEYLIWTTSTQKKEIQEELLIACEMGNSPPHPTPPFPPWASGGGSFYFWSAHSATVSESVLNGPRWRRPRPSCPTKDKFSFTSTAGTRVFDRVHHVSGAGSRRLLCEESGRGHLLGSYSFQSIVYFGKSCEH